MLQFSMGMEISEEEKESVKDIFDAATEGLLLANDYWSWEREYRSFKAGNTKKLVSSIEVLVRTRSLSIEEAQKVVKEMIINAENEYVRRRNEMYQLQPNISIKLRRWIETCGLAVSGNHYWCSACPRQNAWRGEVPGMEQIQESSKALRRKSSVSISDLHINKKTRRSNGSSTSPPSSESNVHVHDSSDGPKIMENGSCKHRAAMNGTKHPDQGRCLESDEQKPSKVSSRHSYKPDNAALESPSAYVASLPSKGVRATLIESLNCWLDVPVKSLKVIEVVITLLHNASLILDDIEDNSPLRRGKAATHTIFGPAQSINSANFMYVKATQQVQKGLNNPQAMDVLLEELEGLYLGQSWDLYWKHNLVCPSEEEYINMVDNKTGGMFSMLLRLMQSESPLMTTLDFDRLTILFGRFFQIRDDYMNFGDYTNQKGFCEDLDEGKFSYPIVHCLESHPEFRGHILGIFRQRPASLSPGSAPLSKESKGHIIACLEAAGAFEATLECLRGLESELDCEIGKLECVTGETNPMLRLLLAGLSVKGLGVLEKKIAKQNGK